MADQTDGLRVGVIGIGNLLLTDDGVGVHAVRALAEDSVVGCVEFIDGGTDPWAALSAARDCRALVVLDAVVGGATPGEIHRLSLDEVAAGRASMSLHAITLFHVLEYERLLGKGFEDVRVVGMEPAVVEPGIGLSDPCAGSLADLVGAAKAAIDEARSRLSTDQGGS
ncbi:MAG: hydrogenase maturation protease [Planctomycetota bacterium]|jgi:hydrogenase maturation protease